MEMVFLLYLPSDIFRSETKIKPKDIYSKILYLKEWEKNSIILLLIIILPFIFFFTGILFWFRESREVDE